MNVVARRLKLSETVAAQLELGSFVKLVLTFNPIQQRGPCRSIAIYDAGLQRLQQERTRIQAALTLDQHVSILLEKNEPPADGGNMDYVVVVTESDHRLTFCHIDLDLVSSTAPGQHLFTPRYQSQNVTLDEKSFARLCTFLTKQSVWKLAPCAEEEEEEKDDATSADVINNNVPLE
jgi:hypothetical protein